MGRTRRLLMIFVGASLLGAAAVPALALAAQRIDFDDGPAPAVFGDPPLTTRYEPRGVTFSGPSPGTGGEILNESSTFGVTGHSSPNFLAFAASDDSAYGPETITFFSPVTSVAINVGAGSGGTVSLTAFDGVTTVASSSLVSTSALATLSVRAKRITSVRFAFTGTALVADDLVWARGPVAANDSFQTPDGAPLLAGAPGVLSNDSDADGDLLRTSVTRGPSNGSVLLDPDGGFVYRPQPGFLGTDSFDYRVDDGTGNSDDAAVVIQVKGKAPVASGMSFARSAFRAASAGGSIARRATPVGSTVGYRLSEQATARFGVARAAAGRRRGSKCVAPTRRNRTAKRCTRFIKLRGNFARAGRAGPNSIRFTGRLRGRKLRAGRYRLTMVATDLAGIKSSAKRADFRIVRR
jgi:hypothetical protein